MQTVHELGIANQIFELLENEAKTRNAKVSGVKLIIGRMSGIMPDSLVFLLQTISKDTICDGVKIEFEMVDPGFKCKDCGHLFTAEEYNFICPKCGNGDCDMISGSDLIVEKIHMELTDED